MQRLVAFNSVTLDGYFTGPNGDLSWAHKERNDPEFQAFVEGNAKGGGVLLFGRVTYELMASYWPTPLATQTDPVVAERMNTGPKVVFSRTLDTAPWRNTTVVKGDLVSEARRMKEEPGLGMTILGSGSIIAQLTQARLIDEYQIVLTPVILGSGRTMFDGVTDRLPVRLTETRPFANGSVFLRYEPVR